MDKKRKQILILVAIASLITVSGIVLAQTGWFTFTENLSGLDESDRRMVDTFILEDLPEYFTAGVVVDGSGYTGQLHTVDVSISHNRPDDSVNIAAGDYSLTLELSGESVETITSGSFTGLRNTAPFIAPSQSWTPSSSKNTYEIVLSLNNIVWTLLPEHTIISSAGEGGTISPLGVTTVLEGDDQIFTITADEGYVIDEILVNEAYVMSFDPYVFDYPFEDVLNDWTIHATFIEATTFVDTLFESEITSFIPIANVGNVLLNGDPLPVILLLGDTVSMEWTIKNIHSSAITKIKYRVEAQISGESRITLIPELTEFMSVSLPVGGEYTISDTFTAPASGSYILILVITEMSSG